MNQHKLFDDQPLKRATFWMQETTLRWLRAYAKVSRISQGALLNAIILDYQLRKLDPTITDTARTASIRAYVDALLGAAPDMVPAPAYRIPQSRPVSQAYKTPK